MIHSLVCSFVSQWLETVGSLIITHDCKMFFYLLVFFLFQSVHLSVCLSLCFWVCVCVCVRERESTISLPFVKDFLQAS